MGGDVGIRLLVRDFKRRFPSGMTKQRQSKGGNDKVKEESHKERGGTEKARVGTTQ